MTEYVNCEMTPMKCGECGVPFMVPRYFDDERQSTGKGWYCPNGHCRVYRKSKVQELEEKLANAQRQAQQQQMRALDATERAKTTERQYLRIRQRIMAGVCPCCNRTFQNVARHMQTQHPEFSAGQRLKALRDAFGLVQKALADEAGVSTPYVSMYENDKELPDWAREAIERWMESQTAASAKAEASHD